MKDIVKQIERSGYDVHGVEVFQHGEVVFSHYFHENVAYPVYSATKSVTSMAVGLAIEEGALSVDDSLCWYLTKKDLEKMPEHKRRDFEKLPIKQFLKMSIPGYPFRPEGMDYMACAMTCETADYTGSGRFSYSNIPAYLVGVACEHAVGMHLMDYLKPRLLDPLEIQVAAYANCPAGHFYGATGMKLTIEQLRKLGQLLLQQGQYQGEQILSKQWAMESTRNQWEMPVKAEDGYGYFIWTRKDGFYISGKWGQKCMVIPERELIVTYMAHAPENTKGLELVMEDVLDRVQ